MMKKFIINTLFCTLPFIVLHVLTYYFFVDNMDPFDSKDVFRIGYVADHSPNYRKIFNNEYSQKIHFNQITDDNITDTHKIFTIGDSFSQQIQMSYQNYLVKNSNFSLLHFGESMTSNNPLQDLYELANGDFFNKNKVEYVILESGESYFPHRALILDTTKVRTNDDIKRLTEFTRIKNKKHPLSEKRRDTIKFPSDRIIKLPFNTLMYYLKNNTKLGSGKIYKVKTTQQLFSVPRKELLFHRKDIDLLKYNNSKESVAVLNDILNKLSIKLNKKNIKLIVFSAPDKYNVYYDYIENKKDYPKPIFYDLMKEMKKDYIYINSKETLVENIGKAKDIYYYDDTHWSPVAAKIIANKIIQVINNNDNN